MSYKLSSKPSLAASYPVTSGNLLNASEPQFSYPQNRDNKACSWGRWGRKSSQHGTWHVSGAQRVRVSSPFSPSPGGAPPCLWVLSLPSDTAASQAWTVMPGRPP